MLLKNALFEDGLIGVGLLVADLDSFVFQLACEFIGVGFFLKFVDVFAVVILLKEEAVLNGHHEARRFRDPRCLAADDAAFHRRPALGSAFVAAFMPSADVDGAPASHEGERPLKRSGPQV